MKQNLRRLEAAAILLFSFAVAAYVVKERAFVTQELGRIGIWSYPLAILIFAVVASAPFSVTDALAVMNGVIFGPVGGTIVNAIGIVAAAIVGYIVALRTSSLLELDKNLERLPAWMRRFKVGSLPFLIVVRIIPGLGGTIATQTAAAKRVPILIHIVAMSAIAIPICTALAIGGDQVAAFVQTRIATPVGNFTRRHHMHLPHMPHVRHHTNRENDESSEKHV